MQNQTSNNEKAAVRQTSDCTQDLSERIAIRAFSEGHLFYCDMQEIEDADYKRVAELDLLDFRLEFVSEVDSNVWNWISRHAAEVRAKCGDACEFDTNRAVIVAGMLGEKAYLRGVDREEFDCDVYSLSTGYDVTKVAHAWLAGWDRAAQLIEHIQGQRTELPARPNQRVSR